MGQFGTLTPAEAQKRSVASRRRRAEQLGELSAVVVVVDRVQASDVGAAIVSALRKAGRASADSGSEGRACGSAAYGSGGYG